MSKHVPPKEGEDTCLDYSLMGSLPPVITRVECEPSQPTVKYKLKCKQPLPESITVSWSAGDGKTAYSPLHLISPVTQPGVNPSPTMDYQVSGDDLGRSLTFVLNREVAQAYYDEIGPIRDWREARNPQPGYGPYGYLDMNRMKSLGGDLYSLAAIQEGKRVTATMTSKLTAWNLVQNPGGTGTHYEQACEETLIDRGVFRNIAVGALYAECNIIYSDYDPNNPIPNYGNLGIYGIERYPPQDPEIVMAFSCRMAMGFVTADLDANPKFFNPLKLIVAIGELPNNGARANAVYDLYELFTSIGGFGTIGIGPIYSESNAVVQGFGWPCYGHGSMSGVFRTNGEFYTVGNFGGASIGAVNGFSGDRRDILGDRLLPGISSTVTFTASL
jgi:hypothetical protein